MGKNKDIIPVFFRSQNEKVEKPCMTMTRKEAKRRRDIGHGQWICHGMAFRLYRNEDEETETKLVPTFIPTHKKLMQIFGKDL